MVYLQSKKHTAVKVGAGSGNPLENVERFVILTLARPSTAEIGTSTAFSLFLSMSQI